jgi:hypothetical protein
MFCKERKKITTLGNLSFELHSFNCTCTLPFLHQDTQNAILQNAHLLDLIIHYSWQSWYQWVTHWLIDWLTNWSFSLLTLSFSHPWHTHHLASDFPATKVPDTDSAVPLEHHPGIWTEIQTTWEKPKGALHKTRINRLCNPGSMNVVVQCLAKLQF